MKRIKKINENNKIEYFDTVPLASASVDTKMDDWKVQMLIVDAINNKKRAFKCKWQKVD